MGRLFFATRHTRRTRGTANSELYMEVLPFWPRICPPRAYSNGNTSIEALNSQFLVSSVTP